MDHATANSAENVSYVFGPRFCRRKQRGIGIKSREAVLVVFLMSLVWVLFDVTVKMCFYLFRVTVKPIGIHAFPYQPPFKMMSLRLLPGGFVHRHQFHLNKLTERCFFIFLIEIYKAIFCASPETSLSQLLSSHR